MSIETPVFRQFTSYSSNFQTKRHMSHKSNSGCSLVPDLVFSQSGGRAETMPQADCTLENAFLENVRPGTTQGLVWCSHITH